MAFEMPKVAYLSTEDKIIRKYYRLLASGILTDYFRVWLTLEYSDAFTKYKESVKPGRLYDWRDFISGLASPNDSNERFFIAYTTFWEARDKLQKLPKKEDAIEWLKDDRSQEAWRFIIETVYNNQARIETQRASIIDKFASM